MVHGQTTPPHPMNFLAGTGEMAARIREYDWADHPFGVPSTWPQSLRSALSICLHSSFPTAIYWGPELRLLYNDAWAPIPGPRHPAALGAPAKQVWSDIWHVIEPQFSQLMATGDGIFVEDQMLPMRRFGSVEETFWSYSLTAIRGEDEAIAGVFNSGFETTSNVLSRRQMSFLLDLNEAFRSAADASAARGAAIRMLGEHLCADRAGLRELTPRSDSPAVVDEWTAEGVPGVGETVSIDQLGEWVQERLRAGRSVRINDVATEDHLAAARDTFVALGVGAALAVPWMDCGKAAAIIFVHSREPRSWTDSDVSTAEQVLNRTLRWMERERTAEHERILMREIDHRARNALAVVQAVAKLTQAADVDAFREKIGDRIAALARAHDLLSGERWRPIELKTLIESELKPYVEPSSNRVRLRGPRLRLPPEHAQTIALLLHELATNAAKYGAFAETGGTLEVSWTGGSHDVVEIDWIEHAPAKALVAAEPEKVGFGSKLLRRVVEDQLGGAVRRAFEKRGLRYHLTVPLGNARGSRQPASTSADKRVPAPVRVLIVEDEAIVALDLEAMIEVMGLGVFAAAGTVDEALERLNEGTPDLAILDVNLAGESSQEVADVLFARGVPVILVTGYARPADMPESLANLPRLVKPVHADGLAKTIRDLGFSTISSG